MDINEIVKAHIQTQLVEALSKDGEDYISKLIEAAVNDPVEDGIRYGSKAPYIQVVVKRQIQEKISEAVSEHVASMSEDIRSSVKARISSDDVIDSFVSNILKVTTEDWRLDVSFSDES